MIHAPSPIADTPLSDLIAGLSEDAADIHAALMSALDEAGSTYTAKLNAAMAEAGVIV